jgi:hypothetical protein
MVNPPLLGAENPRVAYPAIVEVVQAPAHDLRAVGILNLERGGSLAVEA